MRKFAGNFLDTAGIKLIFNINTTQKNRMMEGYKRRSIYHSVKEVLNNTVKYSKASEVEIK
ncbi:MAG: hypothetical protein QM763_16180 [Agriterribacter sp.]